MVNGGCKYGETYEDSMTAGETRILTTDFIAKAMEDIMTAANDDMRVKCFERTGSLLTWLPSEVHDDKIKPQGIKEGLIKIPKERTEEVEENIQLPEGIGPEEAATAEEQRIIDEEEENGNI
jgi:hypothetical protein